MINKFNYIPINFIQIIRVKQKHEIIAKQDKKIKNRYLFCP